MAQHHRYLSADDRRTDLLEAAGRLFARGGIDALTMTAVAQEAAVSRALVYQYFPDQDALAVAYFDGRISQYFGAIDATLDPAAPPVDRAVAGLRELLTLEASSLQAVTTVLASHGDERLAPVRARLRDTTLQRWEPFFTADSDLAVAAAAAEVLIAALATLALATKSGQLTIEQADRMLREYAAATYRAVNG